MKFIIQSNVTCTWDAALKKPVQSFLISVTPGTRIFISLYLHKWMVLRLYIQSPL